MTDKNKENFKKIVSETLRFYEDSLSDGYGYYGNFNYVVEKIVDKIWSKCIIECSEDEYFRGFVNALEKVWQDRVQNMMK